MTVAAAVSAAGAAAAGAITTMVVTTTIPARLPRRRSAVRLRRRSRRQRKQRIHSLRLHAAHRRAAHGCPAAASPAQARHHHRPRPPRCGTFAVFWLRTRKSPGTSFRPSRRRGSSTRRSSERRSGPWAGKFGTWTSYLRGSMHGTRAKFHFPNYFRHVLHTGKRTPPMPARCRICPYPPGRTLLVVVETDGEGTPCTVRTRALSI